MLNRFRLWLAEKLIPGEYKQLFEHGFKAQLEIKKLRDETEKHWQKKNKSYGTAGAFGFSQETLNKQQDALVRSRAQNNLTLAIPEPEEMQELEQASASKVVGEE